MKPLSPRLPSHHHSRETRRIVRFEVAPKSMLLALFLVLALWFLNQLWAVLLVVDCASILAGTLLPAVRWLECHRIKRPWAIAAVFGAALLLLVLWGLATLPALWEQLMEIAQQAPAAQTRLADSLAGHRVLGPWAETVRHFSLSNLMTRAAPSPLAMSLGVLEAIGYAGTTIVLSIYIIADRERARAFLYALVARRYHMRLARVLLKLETIVGGYVRGQVVTSIAMFAFAFVLLLACGVKHALAIAAFAGLADVIPFVGGALATAPAVLAAVPNGEVIAIIVLVALLVYQEFESRILVPSVYGRTLRLPSAAVILALLIGGKLYGIVGALLALPIAATIRMLVEELRVALPGDDSDHADTQAQDRAAERVYAKASVGASPEEAAALATRIADEVEHNKEMATPKAVSK